jgi:hypothetical protein
MPKNKSITPSTLSSLKSKIKILAPVSQRVEFFSKKSNKIPPNIPENLESHLFQEKTTFENSISYIENPLHNNENTP